MPMSKKFCHTLIGVLCVLNEIGGKNLQRSVWTKLVGHVRPSSNWHAYRTITISSLDLVMTHKFLYHFWQNFTKHTRKFQTAERLCIQDTSNSTRARPQPAKLAQSDIRGTRYLAMAISCIRRKFKNIGQVRILR
jgi:hypothetical protein